MSPSVPVKEPDREHVYGQGVFREADESPAQDLTDELRSNRKKRRRNESEDELSQGSSNCVK